MESLRNFESNLNAVLNNYSERLENLREKIEGAARLHHLLALKLNEEDVQLEMQKLAEKIGLSNLMQQNVNHKSNINTNNKKVTGKMTITTTTITTSTPKKDSSSCCAGDIYQPDSTSSLSLISTSILPAIEESPEKKFTTNKNNVAKACQEEDIDGIEGEEEEDGVEENEEKTATLGDSGLGTLDDEEKMLRACSCESIVDQDDATMNACDNLSQHDEDDYDTSENIASLSLDEPPSSSTTKSESNSASVPLQANAHLYCHASNLQLDLDDTIIDQKTQK